MDLRTVVDIQLVWFFSCFVTGYDDFKASYMLDQKPEVKTFFCLSFTDKISIVIEFNKGFDSIFY